MSDWETLENKGVLTSKMNVGDTFEGTFVELKENTTSKYEKTNKDGSVKKQYNLIFTDAAGERIVVYPSGTINYKIDDGAFEAGYDYKITRKENKKGVKAGQFLVQRRKANGTLTAGAPTVNTTAPKGKNGAPKNA